MNKFVIDSSIFIASYIESDKFHLKARKFFQDIAGMNTEVILPIIVVLETVNFLLKHKKEVGEVLERFYALKIIDIDTSFIEKYLFHFGKFYLKTADAILASIAYEEKAILVSFDEKFIKAVKPYLKTLNPSS